MDASLQLPADTVSGMREGSTYPQVGVGIINLPILRTMHDTLEQTANKNDTELAAWIYEHFFVTVSDDNDVNGVIKSDADFKHLYAAYQRVQHLTARACPEKCKICAGVKAIILS
jgi:hypothetical protein